MLLSEEALAAARRARSSGVLFDVSHGAFNFDIHVARRACELSLAPDLISSDLRCHTLGRLTLCSAMDGILTAVAFAFD